MTNAGVPPITTEPRQKSRLERLSHVIMSIGAALAVVGFAMIFAGQTGSSTVASPRELEDMPTIDTGGPFGRAVDKSAAFSEYLGLLAQWSHVPPPLVPSADTTLTFRVELRRETPTPARKRIAQLEQELMSVRLLWKVGSRASYEAHLRTTSIVGLTPRVSRPIYRSRWWESAADKGLFVAIPGTLILYLGVFLWGYNKRRMQRQSGC